MKGEAVRSFIVECCSDANYPWLHYDASSDSAFCYLCMTAVHEGKLLASSKKDAAFLSKGYTCWKEATSAFKKHQASQCYREANEAINLLPQQVGDIGELLSHKHSDQKAEGYIAIGLYIVKITLNQCTYYQYINS